MEVIDLTGTSSCDPLNSYPIDQYGMVAGVVDGFIKACGDCDQGSSACYDYDPIATTWSSGDSMLYERTCPRASVIDDMWLVSGDNIYSDDDPLTSEMWSASRHFVEGPELPHEMSFHCQLTINSTHVFFGDDDQGATFLLDWYKQAWTQLDSPSMERPYGYCGLINNPENGLEIVSVDLESSMIFNINSLSWREGPKPPHAFMGGYGQTGDTFVIVGGSNAIGVVLDTIYEFDHVNYQWILKSQHLETPRERYPGVVAVPDNFVNCS